MFDLMMTAPAAVGFAMGAPTGALFLGLARMAGRRVLRRRRAAGDDGGPAPVALAVATQSIALPVAGTAATLPSRRAPAPRTVEEHAMALARWVTQQRPEGLRGRTISAVELIEVYTEMCGEIGVEPRGWQPVAVELQRLLGIGKRYGTIEGRRVRVYDIPDRTLDDIIADAAARARKAEASRRRPTAALTTGPASLAA